MATQAPPNPLKLLMDELDKDSYEWMAANSPGVLEGIEEAVAGGISADGIKRLVLRQTHRLELSMRCQQAARHAIKLVVE